MMILISGAGIAGLTLGLTLHQLGMPFQIFERAETMQPVGVGINIQPNAVRELYALGFENQLDEIGVKTRDYGFYTKTGKEIWTEQRGTWAGYNWPQYSIHRGKLQMMLYDTLVDRVGPNAVVSNHKAVGFHQSDDHVELLLEAGNSQTKQSVNGDILIACDGIHSAIRKQVVPDEGDPVWGGAVLWRGTTKAHKFLSGASMVLAGHDTQRIVAYPISKSDENGISTINWIAELTRDPAQGWRKEDWNRTADTNEFLPQFEGWNFHWLNVPDLIGSTDTVYEYPMVDRDPINQWTFGNVTLMGDAAHPTYPVGSNGASQAIMDARIVGLKFQKHGVTNKALVEYEEETRPRTTQVTLANRGSGPDAIMQLVEDRCAGKFDDIETVVPRGELEAHAAKYKKIAGFDIQTLNERAELIQVFGGAKHQN